MISSTNLLGSTISPADLLRSTISSEIGCLDSGAPDLSGALSLQRNNALHIPGLTESIISTNLGCDNMTDRSSFLELIKLMELKIRLWAYLGFVNNNFPNKYGYEKLKKKRKIILFSNTNGLV
jgi:hypothetical protein